MLSKRTTLVNKREVVASIPVNMIIGGESIDIIDTWQPGRMLPLYICIMDAGATVSKRTDR